MAAIEQRLHNAPLEDDQRVLAVTFMHGSRQRLAARMRRIDSLRGRFDCMTIDSLAWHLVCRWRGLVAAHATALGSWTFDQRCEAAASLLGRANVRRWLSRCYPVVLVDELQDVDECRLAMIKGLVIDSHVIMAADEYQDLRTTGNSEAVAWMRTVCVPTVLTHCHRTGCTDLLATASSLRAGHGIIDRPSCKVLSAPSAAVGASFVARNLTWFGIAGTVVLSPAGPTVAPFVQGVIDRLGSGTFNLNGTDVGPFHIDWESQAANDAGELIASIAFSGADDGIDTTQSVVPPDQRGGRELQCWIDRQRRVLARARISRGELTEQAGRICQQLRSVRVTRDNRLVAMTIHQAKNREFERAVILWPYQVSNNAETARRLLYNAVTRAKQRAAIIVQNPKTGAQSRLLAPPFSGAP